MASSLPMTLRVYQKLSAAMMPLTPAMIRRRMKQGKEDPARIGERRGISRDIRPHGPLVWIHGASVGEVLAAAALIERLRALKIRILLTSGTVTSAAIVAKRFPPISFINTCLTILRAMSRAFSITGARASHCSSNPICGPTSFCRVRRGGCRWC
jgi:3-deoxy-D-manno-octulosonic-acid transferase